MLRFGRMAPAPLTPRARALAACFLCATTATPPAAAQDRAVVADPPVCADCELTLERVVVLGDVEGPGFVGLPNSLLRTSRGEYLVIHIEAAYNAFVFDSTGRFLRTVGRKGEGPGEYRFLIALRAGAGDTVHAFDSSLARRTVLSERLAPARTTRLPTNQFFAVQPLEGDRLLVNAHIATRERIGFPLHVVGPDGSVLRSFGTDEPVYRRDMPGLNRRVLGPVRDGRFWTAHRTRYVLELWDVEGRKLRELERPVDWFQPHAELARTDRNSPPKPFIGGLHEDGDGLLWVTLWVASENWREAPVRTGRLQGRTMLRAGTPRDTRDAIIEVIDPRSGRLVARARFPEALQDFAEDGLTYSYRETAEGVPRIDVWRVRLEGGARAF